MMNVLKFGGTSVGSPERMKEVAKLIISPESKLVVLSAMSGTTNALVEIADYFKKGNPEGANLVINQLRTTYIHHINELYSTVESVQKIKSFFDKEFTYLHSFSSVPYSEVLEKTIIAQGEIISTTMFAEYLRELGQKVLLVSAFDFMKLSENGEPDLTMIRKNLTAILEQNPNYQIYLTQGFIGLNHLGKIDNLQRGGSDYTACLIGAALKCNEVQIWTDIDGMHNNDPRIVDNTEPVRNLNFEEAAELAYFGAKILHPTCIQPARYARVPVRLLNTMNPKAPGTIINNKLIPNRIKAVAAKDEITVIKIVSSRMLLASGFLSKVFEIFSNHKTSIDMVTTSEVGVSLSIDNTSHLALITEELKKYGTVIVEQNMCIVCVVGDLRWENRGFESTITNALEDVPLRMISFGGSDHNISFLIKMEDKERALKSLSRNLFGKK